MQKIAELNFTKKSTLLFKELGTCKVAASSDCWGLCLKLVDKSQVCGQISDPQLLHVISTERFLVVDSVLNRKMKKSWSLTFLIPGWLQNSD